MPRREAMDETMKMVNVYADFAENFMAMPVIKGAKTESERFAGAIETYTIEALMQDGKALQSGTSHFFRQNFAKAFDVKFTSQEGNLDYVWATSWGVATRLVGALIMAHSDDQGLVLPPKLAPIQVVIIPIYKTSEQKTSVFEKCETIYKALKQAGISVKLDGRDNQTPGWKFAEYELKGVPVRIAIGPRDVENGTLEIARRGKLAKEFSSQDGIAEKVKKLLDDIQTNIYQKALNFRNEKTCFANTYDEFKELIEKKARAFLGSLGRDKLN